jgi:activator of 2-hydroxyglutaryl-CoA dehydratase
MCAVFAESEVVSLMAKGATREAIARGVLESIADRAIGLLGKHSSSGALAFTGGLSRSRVLVSILEQRLGMPVYTSPSSQIAGALGGAVIGWN